MSESEYSEVSECESIKTQKKNLRAKDTIKFKKIDKNDIQEEDSEPKKVTKSKKEQLLKSSKKMDFIEQCYESETEFYSVNQIMNVIDEYKIKYQYACVYFKRTSSSQYGRSAPIERVILIDKNMKIVKDFGKEFTDDFINISFSMVRKNEGLFNKQDSQRQYLRMIISKEVKGTTENGMIYHDTDITETEDYERKHLGLIVKQFKIVF